MSGWVRRWPSVTFFFFVLYFCQLSDLFYIILLIKVSVLCGPLSLGLWHSAPLT